MLAGDFRFSAGTEIFEPLVREDVALYPEHNQIDVWTWGDFACCLEAGATLGHAGRLRAHARPR